MNGAKQTGGAVREGSGNAPVVGGSVQTGSPTEQGKTMPDGQPDVAQLVSSVNSLIEQNKKLMEMNASSQQVIGKLGNEIGQMRRAQPAITPEMKRQFKTMLEDEDQALDAVGLIANTATKSYETRDNQVLDAFFRAKGSDPQLQTVGFDEFKWQALQSGVPLESLSDPGNARQMLNTIISSRPIDLEAVKNAAKAEGAKEAEAKIAALLKEKGVSALVLPSSNGGVQQTESLVAPLTDDEEQDKFALIMSVNSRQISKDQIPEAKRLRYGIK